MSRIVVLGGTGYFGRLAALALRERGAEPIVAARSASDLRVDVEDRASIRGALAWGDVAIDIVGPFQSRTTALVETAMEVGFHVVDISDSAAYAERLQALDGRIASSGIAVLSSCSSLSVVSAALVRRSRIGSPVRVSAFLRPATRHTANPATAASALRSLGRPIRVLRAGALADEVGMRASRSFGWPAPVGPARGRLTESADAVHLPRIWPSLRDVDFWVDPNVLGLSALLALAARARPIRWIVERTASSGVALARALGGTIGVFGVEVEGDGRVARLVLTGPSRTERTAVLPAALAACALADGSFASRGLVAPDRQVDGDALFAALAASGIECFE